MNWLNRLERKAGKLAIPHLMYYISGGMLIVFLIEFLFPNFKLLSMLTLDMNQVAQGQVWRLVTFIFAPTSSSPIWIIFSLYFYCLLGESLEREWGSFRFCLFYLTGMVGAILAALITGFGMNTYLNLSIFLAFAFFYPDFQVMVFFFIPVKVKYLALLDLALLVWSFITNGWEARAAILFSLLNVVLYFGGHFIKNFKRWLSFRKTRNNFRKYMR